MTKESKLNQPDATVWSAPSSEDVIGPVFFGKTVNGENYMEILCDLVVPQLRTKAVFDELFFQQGGASLHYVLTHVLTVSLQSLSTALVWETFT